MKPMEVCSAGKKKSEKVIKMLLKKYTKKTWTKKKYSKSKNSNLKKNKKKTTPICSHKKKTLSTKKNALK